MVVGFLKDNHLDQERKRADTADAKVATAQVEAAAEVAKQQERENADRERGTRRSSPGRTGNSCAKPTSTPPRPSSNAHRNATAVTRPTPIQRNSSVGQHRSEEGRNTVNDVGAGFETRPFVMRTAVLPRQSDDGSCFASCNSIGSPFKRRSHLPALVISTETLPSAEVSRFPMVTSGASSEGAAPPKSTFGPLTCS